MTIKAVFPTSPTLDVGMESSFISFGLFGPVAIARLPSDPVFLASATLENVVVGSRYRLTNNANGTELATGVVSSDPEIIPNVPAYSSNMTIKASIRNASSAPFYKEYIGYATHNRAGTSIYIVQELDQ